MHCLIHLASSDIICPIFDSEEDMLLLAAKKVDQVGPKAVQSGQNPLKKSEKSGFYSLKWELSEVETRMFDKFWSILHVLASGTVVSGLEVISRSFETILCGDFRKKT